MINTSPAYHHKQTGWVMIYVFAGIVMLAFLLMALMGNPLDRPELIAAWLAPLMMLGVSAVCLPLFYQLTTIVDDRAVEIRFGIGLIRFRFPLETIASAAPVQNKLWHGWGIHWIGAGWVYNVSGWDAVELQMRSGKRNRIGTDDPDRLAEAIRQRLPAAPTREMGAKPA